LIIGSMMARTRLRIWCRTIRVFETDTDDPSDRLLR
jgi:hypothetical protein